MSRSYVFNTFIQNNVNLTFGSDWDVTPLNPLEGIYAAVSRKTLDGSNPDGWYPEQKISIFEAIKCYTKNNAYAGFQEHRRGFIFPGFDADLTILSKIAPVFPFLIESGFSIVKVILLIILIFSLQK